MSLQVEPRSRGRSRSPGGRERDSSRVRSGSAIAAPLTIDTDPYRSSGGSSGRERNRERDRDDDYINNNNSGYGDRKSSYRPPVSPSSHDKYPGEFPTSPRASNEELKSRSRRYTPDSDSDSDDDGKHDGYVKGSKYEPKRGGDRDRQREKDRDRDREVDRQSDRERDKAQRERERERERERDRDKDHGRDRDRDSDRDRRDRDRDRERDRERDLDYGRGSKDRDGNGVKGLMDAYLPQKYAKQSQEPDTSKFMKDPFSSRERERSRDRRDNKRESRESDLAFGGLVSPTVRDARPSSPFSERSERSDRDRDRDSDRNSSHRPSYSRNESSKYGPDSLTAGRHGSSAREPSPGPSYGRDRDRDRDRERERERAERPKHYRGDSLTTDPRSSSGSVVTVEPGVTPRKSAMKRSSSPQPPAARMSSLSIGGLGAGLGAAAAAAAAGHHMSVSAAPGSPLLESYHGTYQSMSPMPSPLLLPTQNRGANADVLDVSPIGSDDERGGKKHRRARFSDPLDDAKVLADALKGHKPPKLDPLIEILPGLTQEQIMELRVKYKEIVKTGEDRKGVNVAKHIRARLKDEDPNLMKACYSTALGRWESEAYWSSFWYQGDKTRRELLIESLMGRTNDEIRQIKNGFNDKKYDNSLAKCMRQELKEDKFKKAVLMVLEEQRMDDDTYHRPGSKLVRDDVSALHKAVKAEKGGESAMIAIVVNRSDTHLREVLKVYTEHYQSNFARDALKKSGNLVGEMLAHILNGVINRPVRDALLVHHALTASKKDALRRELLISRLVRFHWDAHHMAAVKAAYRERYGKDMQGAVKDMTMGQWGQFCHELCIGRMPDHVKRVERVDVLKRHHSHRDEDEDDE